MLFSEEIKLNLPDAEISYFPKFFNLEEANTYFELLLNDIPWQQDDITVFGKTYAQPRLTALFGHSDKPYSYSNIIMHPRGFTSALSDIKKKIDEQAETIFTTCLANLYRDGQDSNGWHADNEKTLGTNPIIASITFGGPRYFNLKHKDNKDLKHKLLLEHGSLLLMKGTTQHHWLHQIAKTRQEVKPRINLTFRIIK
ncbi:alpha-ketoglutarate-dependent dioxygenase AlkB family protein [Olleya sp. HaHaR_3_96]|uniref:alpha-ketoglutarate-dependent dioxygenase AlkB family protein n=1 Tax=Olleya sp. HaHaR_3_96 TaxID=2745560 RepID=UPI001C50258B|nr:alpha-ketoglutarate-dependent dioxygenase AlkB [Olleya sp. HaHaR_3_96]QXP61464.1 alpha-ketoglutarate-dependent dioxygenase AlkB [Olleya sp. HaHaR_3_96]